MSLLPDIDGWKEGTEDNLSTIPNCYCPNCGGGNAKTVMLPTKVPMFREIYIMCLTCPDCNFKNSEVQFGGEIQTTGETLTLNLTDPSDLDRQIIKSDSASFSIPSLSFEIPPGTQKGSVSTIEGVLMRAAANLEALQPERLRLGDVDNFHRCREVILRLKSMAGYPEPTSDDEEEDDEDNDEEGKKEGEESGAFVRFTIVLDDPAGNSFIENPHAPSTDPNLTSLKYQRTPMQDMALGLQPSKAAVEDGTIDDSNPAHRNVRNAGRGNVALEIDKAAGASTIPRKSGSIVSGDGSGDRGDSSNNNENGAANLGKQEALKFPTTCASCYASAETTMCVTDIPHFKEVIIMSLICEKCGYKSNEIKGGGSIPKFGTKIYLRVEGPQDLGREVLKSDTAGITIPEIELELDEGGLDGLYTTVEGLMDKLHKRLESANPFGRGDAVTKHHKGNDGGAFSEPSGMAVRYKSFLKRLKGLREVENMPFTLIISDPLSNSFVGPVPEDAMALTLQAEREDSNECYKHYVDKGMEIVEYERTHEQNEVLGLNDMKTENYQTTNEDGATNADGEKFQIVNHGTDQPGELPDRLMRLDVRGPDHPHSVAKGPAEGDNTVMGTGSANFATPGLAQRGNKTSSGKIWKETVAESPMEIIKDVEKKDQEFIMCEEFDGVREGMVYKDGAQGLGYYTDVPILEVLKDLIK